MTMRRALHRGNRAFLNRVSMVTRKRRTDLGFKHGGGTDAEGSRHQVDMNAVVLVRLIDVNPETEDSSPS